MQAQNASNRKVFDAIVIGSGISGSWVAKELCEKNVKTLMIERGRKVEHVKDYPTMQKDPWELNYRGRLPYEVEQANPIASRCYAFDDTTKHYFVKDDEHPYIQEKPFDWIRGYQVGGKSLIWARQVQRWSKYEFLKPSRDGYGIAWPIDYEEIAPWYDHVEEFIGVSGNHDGLETLPDGKFLKPWEMNKAEKVIQKAITKAYPERDVIIGRCAHLTEPKEIHHQQGRAQCQARNLCYRGCPFGAYFSSNASTIPWAQKTGNLTIAAKTIVKSIIYDEQEGRAIGVKVIDLDKNVETEYFAKVIFVNAATVNTNLILLNSKSNRFPRGLGNDNDLLGRYIAFHNYRGSMTATLPGHLDSYYYGRRPTAVMMPNFKNIHRTDSSFQGGYMTFYSAARESWNRTVDGPQAGKAFKEKITTPGNWSIYMMMQGETIPKYNNHVRLSDTQSDQHGIPKIIASVDYDENDEQQLADFLSEGEAMLKAAGCIDIKTMDSQQAPGLDIHVMGGARMGNNPTDSIVNHRNQLHHCKNVFVTDGACMSSTGVQNPSLTFMALAARAANYAADNLL